MLSHGVSKALSLFICVKAEELIDIIGARISLLEHVLLCVILMLVVCLPICMDQQEKTIEPKEQCLPFKELQTSSVLSKGAKSKDLKN